MIFQLADFHFPERPERLYPHTPDRPWVLEIGFGDGRFWPHHAATFAEAPNYLGVELSGVSLLKAQRRLRGAGLDNAIVTKLPADVLLREVVPSGALDAIVVNFPDPWPKAGHLDHRLLRASFFRMAADRLKPGGAVLLTTDHQEYFDFAVAEAQASGAMQVELTAPPPAALETKYARKWRDLGLDARHARFTPTGMVTAARSPSLLAPYPEDDHAVPHAILTLPPHFSPTDFEKQTARAGGWTVVLLDLYASLRRDGWVVLAHVVEDDLTQEVLIGVTGREDGSHLVRLAKFGGPIITPGVKAAVGVVTEWLVGQGAQVTHRGY
ncbi:tRNA (guanine(46)-N(7))-methyltransferase TrmB [Deinococcus aerophilus]|uniref:tRNA (guanine-N(7)-)-methyltransferase n=1 Tax=Deinococcus aerophilus TaxID=522488 RepID=A0ABQ2GXK7_9DEIO|nr:tRNA (guanine-N7)-methyltransferase [Deinococcus aerophilus]GGM18886.1 tRNA (guanine-N(7)-)-methyltransferase [Deinococcus aerophilus]